MKNVADLKRTLVIGRQIEMLTYNHTTPPEKIRGVREVVKVQTNGVWLNSDPTSGKWGSWMEFPKASSLEIHTSKHFTIRDKTENGEVWCVREYLIKN